MSEPTDLRAGPQATLAALLESNRDLKSRVSRLEARSELLESWVRRLEVDRHNDCRLDMVLSLLRAQEKRDMAIKDEILTAIAASDVPLQAIGEAVANVAADVNALLERVTGALSAQDVEDLKAAIKLRVDRMDALALAARDAAAIVPDETPTTPPTEPPIEPPPPPVEG